jgi:spore coat protein U-like protein
MAWSFAAHNQKLIFLYSTKTDKIMKKFLLLTAIASAASVAAVAPVMANGYPANSRSSTVTINANTSKSCTTPSNLTIPLGEYDGTAAIGPIAANVTFKCTNGTPATVAFSSASTGSANSGNLIGGAVPIAYTFAATGTSGTGNGLNTSAAALTSTANISIAADQSPSVGPKTDNLNVTVSY